MPVLRRRNRGPPSNSKGAGKATSAGGDAVKQFPPPVFFPFRTRFEASRDTFESAIAQSYSWESTMLGDLKHRIFPYLQNMNQTSIVPVTSFASQPAVDFLKDMTVGKLAFDVVCKRGGPNAQSKVWLAEVVEVVGYRVLLKWVGVETPTCDDPLVWINVMSDDLHAVFWAAQEPRAGQFSYVPPPRVDQSGCLNSTKFEKILKDLNEAGVQCIENFDKQVVKWRRGKFKVGMRVELLDKRCSTRVRPARVKAVRGRRVHLKVEGPDYDAETDDFVETKRTQAIDWQGTTDENYEFWVDCDSHYILPVGFAASNSYTICAANSYLKHTRKIAQCIAEKKNPPYDDMDATPGLVTPRVSKAKKKSLGEHGGFEVGMTLEFFDPFDKNLMQLKIGTVTRLLTNGYILVKADVDCAGDEAIPLHFTSWCLFPLGYASQYGIHFVRPKDRHLPTFKVGRYLELKDSTAVPEECFAPAPSKKEMLEMFPLGSSLEASDHNDGHSVFPSRVHHIRGRLLEISYDGWSRSDHQFFDYRSYDIFPIGWAEAHGFVLEKPEIETGTYAHPRGLRKVNSENIPPKKN